ncbi:MAG: heparinase II/III family protein [Victivallaceae bacterium]|jgi:hypothetical protein
MNKNFIVLVLFGLSIILSQAYAVGGPLERVSDGFQTAPIWDKFWETPGNAFKIESGRLIASSNGKSLPENILATKLRFKDFIVQWNMTRLEDSGSNERLQVIVGAPGCKDKDMCYKYSKIIWLNCGSFKIGQSYDMRLVCINGGVKIYCRPGNSALPEKTVFSDENFLKGRNGRSLFGFRHYNNFNYAYGNVVLTDLNAGDIPVPENFMAFSKPDGRVQLAWNYADDLAGAVKFEVWRSSGTDIAQAEKIAETEDKQFTDISLPTDKTVSYKIVVKLTGQDRKGVSGKVVNVAAGRQASPEKVRNLFACKRMDGGTSLVWYPPAAGTVSRYLISRKDSQGKEEKIGEVNWDKLFFCDKVTEKGAEYAVAAENSIGKSPVYWRQPENPEPLQFAGNRLKEMVGYQNSMWQVPVPLKVDKNSTGARPHPRVLFTEADIARGKENIAKYPWAKSALEQIVNKAEKGMKSPPAENKFEQEQAYAYVLTGEKKYGAKVAEFLLYYADRYKSLPLKNGEARIGDWQMNDYGFARYNASEPYDLIYNSGILTEKDKQHIENDLLRPLADDLMMPRRGEGSIFHTYINFQCMAVAAVGQLGFCLNEQKYIDWAISGKYGFFTLLAGGLRDDGLWWEKGLAYHVTTALPPLIELARAAHNNNIDLWNTPVPDRSEMTNNFNYAVDGDNGPKTLKMAFEAPLYAMFPDGGALNFGDSCDFPYVMNDNLIASAVYNDPKINFCPDRSYPWIKIFCGTDELMQGTPFKPGTAKFANNGICENGSSLFPSTGIAVLRSDADNTDAHAVAFTFGPLGVGHNHGDKLAILLYANRYVPVFKVDYRRKDIYEKQTICDNTVTVDESSQLAESFDSAQRPLTGRLNFFYADKNMQTVSAYTNNAYDGVCLERTLISGAGGVADFFICRSPNPHQYDYALHIEGNWVNNKTDSKGKRTLGQGNGYQFAQVLNETGLQLNYSNCWTYPAPAFDHKIGVSIFSDKPATFFDCMAPGNKTDEAPMVVARVNAQTAVFVSFFDLYDSPGTVKNIEKFETAITPDKIAAGLKVTKAGCTEFFLYNESDERVKIGPFQLSGKAAWARVSDGKITAMSIAPFKEKNEPPQLILE